MEDKLTITNVRKNSEGDITDVKLNDGSTYSLDEVINLVQEGKIDGVNVSRSKNGRAFLRGNPDQDINNNLDQLPKF